MKEKQKYFVFNKVSDFQQGYGNNIDIFPTGIRIKDVKKKQGFYFTKVLDSKEEHVIWHRFKAKMQTVGDNSVVFNFYVSDTRTVIYEEQVYDMQDLIHSETIPFETKLNLMKSYKVKQVYAVKDLLLFDMQGRYLWMVIELYGQGEKSPEVTFMQMIFPKETWLEYLPEVYQQDQKSAAFLERFLGIYQSVYQDMTKKIEHVSQNLEPDTIDSELLLWMSEWFDIDNVHIWSTQQLRYLLKNAVCLYKKRGTVEYLCELIHLYTGKQPYVIEHQQLVQFKDNNEYYQKLIELYGESIYEYTVIIDTRLESSNQDYRFLAKIVESATPAYMLPNIVILKPYLYLDHYTYVGINSVLNSYRGIALDGASAVALTMIQR